MRRNSDLPAEILPGVLHGYTSEERLRLVLSSVRAGIWEVDLISGHISWSPEMYQIYGCDPETEPVFGAEFIERFVHPDDRASGYAQFATIVSGSGGSQLDYEYRAIRADGGVIWISAMGHVRRDDEGRPIFVIGIHRDITKRKRIEQAREETIQFIDRMAAVTPDMIYVLDIQQGQTIFGFRTYGEVLGYGPIARSKELDFAVKVMHPDDRERIAAFRRSIPEIADNSVAQAQYRALHADGTWRWFLVRLAPFARDTDGRLHQVVGATIEITEQKGVENDLRSLNAELEQRVAERTAELSAANRELEAFVNSASHDLRAPLRAIDGFSQLLLEDFGAQLDDHAHQFLNRIIGSAAKLRELMDSLLALSRASRGQLTPVTVNVSEFASTIATEIRCRDPARNVSFVIADNISAIADAALLRIVIENLLENAWKFTRGREHALIEFGVHREDHAIYFIKDNGVGFDMAYAEKVFEPFQRFHEAGQFPGTGLGLATVQRIITRHGGRIWAESTSGSGTVFFFTLGCSSSQPVGGQEGFAPSLKR